MDKLIFLALLSSAILISCSRWDCHPKVEKCAVVQASEVPVSVSEGFSLRYPSIPVSIWFNKNNHGFCAFFDSNGKIAKANFDNNGVFLYEEIHGGRSSRSRMHDRECVCEP